MRVPSTIVGDASKPLDITRHNEYLARTLNGKVSYGYNMLNPSSGAQGVQNNDANLDIWKAHGTTPGAANTDFTITHSLTDQNGKPRLPINILGQDTNNGGLLYRSPVTAWTKSTVTLRCTTASAAYNVIIT